MLSSFSVLPHCLSGLKVVPSAGRNTYGRYMYCTVSVLEAVEGETNTCNMYMHSGIPGIVHRSSACLIWHQSRDDNNSCTLEAPSRALFVTVHEQFC